jgi:ribosomal protein S18 acetylase RimI-like enzyme
MVHSSATIRRATLSDAPAIGALGLRLALQHQGYDAQRFFVFGAKEETFTDFFVEQLQRDDVAILVAEVEGEIVGFVFNRLEPASLVELCDTSGWIHDIFLDESARGHGLGKALLDAAIQALHELGAPIIKLAVSPKNETARRLFEKVGFRATMHEMTFKPDSV